jgi:hypothetical protein
MTPDELHDRAMATMDRAEKLAREGRGEASREEHEKAAELEQRAADAVPEDRPRTRGILRVGAVSLLMRAGHLTRAAGLARRYLEQPLAPGYARQLHELLSSIELELDAVSHTPPIPSEQVDAFLEQLKQLEERIARGDVPLVRLPLAA